MILASNFSDAFNHDGDLATDLSKGKRMSSNSLEA